MMTSTITTGTAGQPGITRIHTSRTVNPGTTVAPRTTGTAGATGTTGTGHRSPSTTTATRTAVTARRPTGARSPRDLPIGTRDPGLTTATLTAGTAGAVRPGVTAVAAITTGSPRQRRQIGGRVITIPASTAITEVTATDRAVSTPDA